MRGVSPSITNLYAFVCLNNNLKMYAFNHPLAYVFPNNSLLYLSVKHVFSDSQANTIKQKIWLGV